MDSFEDLGLIPELVEALAAEGIERPTPLQEAALPVIRRGNNVVLSAGPGGGTLVAYGAGLLDRLDAEEEGLQAIVLVPFAEAARQLAICLGRLAATTGHTVAALGSTWARPEESQVLFCAPRDLLDRIGRSAIRLDTVKSLVMDGLSTICSVVGRDVVESIIEAVPEDAQRVVVSLPLTDEVANLAERHVRRGVHIPPRAVSDRNATSVPDRGTVDYRIVSEPREEAALSLLADLLSGGTVERVVLYVRSEDRAADVADMMTLHGFPAGAPGAQDFRVWVAVDEIEALPAVEGVPGLMPVSVDVPSGPDALDRRHGAGRGGYVLALPRELAHLKNVAALTGYSLVASPPPDETHGNDGLAGTLGRLETALSEEDVDAYLRVLEPLFERHGPAEIAAAAVALLRKKAGTTDSPTRSGRPAPGPSWTHLWLSLGHRDDAGPGDIVGAITGEAGIQGSRVGRIDIKDSFSVVEVEAEVAEKVIAALNGVTFRGRSLRVDYDRGGRPERSARPGPGGPGKDRSRDRPRGPRKPDRA